MLSYRNQSVTQTETQPRAQTYTMAHTIQAQKQYTAGQQAYRFRNWSGPTGAVPGVEDMPPAHNALYSGSNIRKRAPVLTMEGCGYAGAPLTSQDRTAVQAVPGAEEVLSPAASKPLNKLDDKPEARQDARTEDRWQNRPERTPQEKLEAGQDAGRQTAMQDLYRQKTMMRLRSLIPLLDNAGGAVRKLFMETCYSLKNEYSLREETERAQEAEEAPKAQSSAVCNTDNAETLSCSFSPRF